MQNKKWYVAYTVPRCEKMVDGLVKDRGINCFLPMVEQERKWSDRIKKVQTPLFPGYLFVNTSVDKLYDLYQIDQLLRFISFDQKFATVSDKEIDAIKSLLYHRYEVKPEDRVYRIGERVKIGKGPLKGMEGMLVSKNSTQRFVIQIKTLNRSIQVDIPSAHIQYV